MNGKLSVPASADPNALTSIVRPFESLAHHTFACLPALRRGDKRGLPRRIFVLGADFSGIREVPARAGFCTTLQEVP